MAWLQGGKLWTSWTGSKSLNYYVQEIAEGLVVVGNFGYRKRDKYARSIASKRSLVEVLQCCAAYGIQVGEV